MVFNDHLLQAQEQCILTKRKSGKNAKRPVWMNKELLDKVNHKREAYKQQKHCVWNAQKLSRMIPDNNQGEKLNP